jgi:hypothetical protein
LRNARLTATLAFFAGGLVACSTETTVTIRAQGENAAGETVPLSNVTLDLVPFDIDDIYQELEAETQPGTPPAADTLSVLAAQYQEVCTAYRSTGDSIEAVRQRATQVARTSGETSPEYRAAFDQYQALVGRERSRFDQCQGITDDYTAVRNEYREARRAWEERAWPEASFVAAESARIGELTVQRVETDAEGVAVVTIPNGTWWVLGTAPIPGSISQQYRWNVQVEAAGGEQTIDLTSENAELQPVY